MFMFSVQSILVHVLSLSLIYSPMLAAPIAVPQRIIPALKRLPIPVILAVHEPGELLVKFKDNAPLMMREQVRTNYGGMSARMVSGSSQIERLTLNSGQDVAQAIAELQQLAAVVEWVEPNYQVQTETTRKAADKGRKINAATRRRKERTVATSPLVAVIDTGISATHPDLRSHQVAGWNVLTDTADTNDDNGHGTQMAGIIAQVHPQARLLPLKALDGAGVGAVSAVVAAMDRAVAQHAAVILYSFGTDGKSNALLEAIQRAEKSGVVVITAAGNDGQDLATAPQYPAAFTAANLLTVAASNAKAELADFSNYGQAAQVAAPGVGVKTTTPAHAFTRISGTSASAAYVAGVASRLKAVRPWVSAPTIIQSITRSAQQLPALTGKVSAGLVNANAALRELQDPKPTDKPKEEKAPINKKLEERKKQFKARKAQKELVDPEMPKSFQYDLETTRSNRPAPPEARVRINARQGAGYDDPVPTSTANFPAYFTELTKALNDTGLAGSKPMQQVDPTTGVSAIGGLSHNMLSRNLNFTAPVLSLAGRGGLNLALGLSYNSNVWTKNPATNTMFYNAERGFGAIQGLNNSGNIGPYTNSVTGKASFLYIQPDGTKRDLAYNATSGKYESYDSSYLDFDATSKILRTTSGTQVTFGVSATASGDYQFLPTQIKDRNGNFISIVYKQLSNNDTVLDYVIDTLGRRIDFYYQNNRLTEIRQDRNGTIFKYAIIDYTPITLSASFYNTATGVYCNQDVSGTTVYVPSRITYPTGVNLRFVYTGYGQVTAINKWVPTISGQGSERSIASTVFDLVAGYDRMPYLTRRMENAENWVGTGYGLSPEFYYTFAMAGYGCAGGAYTCPQGKVVEPGLNGPNTGTSHTIINGSNNTQITMINGVTYDVYGSPSSVLLKTINTTYTSDSGVSYASNLRPISSSITDQSNQTRKVGLSYLQQDGIWLVQHKDDYAANGTTVYRRTTMSYTSYPAQRILGLPLTTATYAGPGTTLLAKSENIYDETSTWQDSGNQSINYFLNAGATVQHDDANYGAGFVARGNLTTVKQYATDGTTNRIIGRTSYDTNGNARHTADAAGNRKSVDLTDNFTNKPGGLGALQAYPYLTSDPIGMKAGAQYNYYTGQVVKTFAQRPNQSAEEQITTTTYDFADRPLRTTSPTGSYVELGYWDNLLRQTTYTKRDVVGGVDQLVYSWQDFNGAGLVIRKGSDHPNGGAGKYSGQKFKYDTLGRGVEQSNVLAVTSSFAIDTTEPGQTGGYYGTDWKWTAAEFDGLGRTAAVEKPDNTYIFNDYSVCGCAGGLVTDTYDERNNRKTTENDFLGRLQYAREYAPYYSYDPNGQPYISDYSLHAEVEYVYDGLDRLTAIIHRAGPGYPSAGKLTGPGQTRSFAYDIWGRAQSETTPEAGTVSYTYTTNDQIATTTNANGKITTVAYNNRNLVTGISYNDTTPAVSYGYDDYGARTAMTDGEGAMSYVYDGFRRLQTETRTFSGLAGKSYRYTYDFNLGGQLKQADYTALNSSSQNVPAQQTAPARSEIASTGGIWPSPFAKLGTGLSYSPTLTLLLPARKGLTRDNPSFARIVGYVKRPAAQGGQPIAGATVNCQQTTSANMNEFEYIHVTTTTNSSGYYACENISWGNYVNYAVTATAPGWQMSPTSQAVAVGGETDFPADFTAMPASSTTTISGVITSPGGQALSGVTVTLSGTQSQTTTSGSNGQYSFTVNTMGTYTVQPSKSGYTFAPTTINLSGFVTPQTANFQALLGPASPPSPPAGSFFQQTVKYQYKTNGALSSIGTSLLGGASQGNDNVIEAMTYNAFGAATQVSYGNNRKATLGYDQSLMRLTGMTVARPNGSDLILSQGYSYTENGLISYIGMAWIVPIVPPTPTTFGTNW
jgi:YD repeat-containing protein